MTSQTDRRAAERALQALADEHGGRVTPEMVVGIAKDPDSPLHGFFTWDDEAAGAQHRLMQARALIRSVRVVVKMETRDVQTPFFVRDPEQPAKVQGYVSLPRLRTETDAARAAIVAEFSRASAALQRARAIAAALDLEDEVTELADRLGLLQAAVAQGGAAVGAPS